MSSGLQKQRNNRQSTPSETEDLRAGQEIVHQGTVKKFSRYYET